MTALDDAGPAPALRPGPLSAWAVEDDLAVVEQAKGVLIYRFATESAEAERLLHDWAGEAGVTVEALAKTVVHELCQGRPCPHAATWLVRWLEDRLRR